jgi:2Fe-2S ferredoxin
MPTITYILSDGSNQVIDVQPGDNFMRTAVLHNVPGVVAECGGAAMCATCHIYLSPEGVGLLPPIGEVENEMLDSAAEGRSEFSRLSCQLTMPTNVENITVRVAESQF